MIDDIVFDTKYFILEIPDYGISNIESMSLDGSNYDFDINSSEVETSNIYVT